MERFRVNESAVFSESFRRLSVGAGAVCLVSIPLIPRLGDDLAIAAFIVLVIGSAAGLLELLVRGSLEHRRDSSTVAAWKWVAAATVVAVASFVAVQSWFRPGTFIAAGDLIPTEGTAWVGRMFEPWAWSGSNLGGPSELSLLLPFGACLHLVGMLGGDPTLAQRVWYTFLFVGAAMAAFGLFSVLGMSPIASVVGTCVYVLSPFVVSSVGFSPVYLAALGLAAAAPGAVIAVGVGRVSLPIGVTMLALTAPLLGYAYLNPPLAGMVASCILAAPTVAWAIDSRSAAQRSVKALLVGVPLLLLASSYWLVPSFIHLRAISVGQFAATSSWTWTETRATLANAFWLNTIWTWAHPEYAPFAKAYSVPPLSIVAFILPAIAFLGVGIVRQTERGDLAKLRMALIAAIAALCLIFVSTGTNPPGNMVFNLVYRLPGGWLLREPGRFLMLVGLAYAILVGGAVDEIGRQLAEFGNRITPYVRQSVQWLSASVAIAIAILLGFPLETGAVVPDARPYLPGAHVHVPAYWKMMAAYTDGLTEKGAVLVLPPDDFYQMPYTWGYYGDDSFIVYMFSRKVLVPNGQGYSPASQQILNAVQLTATSILSHDWPLAEAVTRALGTPLILVRNDVASNFEGRSIVPPRALSAALQRSPDFRLLRQFGDLELFSLTQPSLSFPAVPVTTESHTPDLGLLGLLPAGAALISASPRANISSVVEAPPLQSWSINGASLNWTFDIADGRNYQVLETATQASVAIDQDGVSGIGTAAILTHSSAAPRTLTVSLPAESIISDGAFSHGLWGPVGDCNRQPGNHSTSDLSAELMRGSGPAGLPALRLTASAGVACEATILSWHGRPVIVNLWARSVNGAPARICIWETGPNHCATAQAIPYAREWVNYRASVVPDPGTSSLTMFLYATVNATGNRTVTDYADVKVLEVPASYRFSVFGSPQQHTAPSPLLVQRETYSDQWMGPTGAQHVLVDGFANGWLSTNGVRIDAGPVYSGATAIRLAQLTSVLAISCCLIVLVSFAIVRSGWWTKATWRR